MKNLDQEKVVAGRSISEILTRFDKKIKTQDLFLMEKNCKNY